MSLVKDNLTEREHEVYLALQEKSRRNIKENSLKDMEQFTEEELAVHDKVFHLMERAMGRGDLA